ncbi:MAG TPA: prepilin-type N-terminal cleavage/methylation domain-containing protein [Pirellulaceae bacterium]|nr:prepilin-type N-terminal cleavage/methylation domain-containing protein [Pirellulaceae bacterium]
MNDRMRRTGFTLVEMLVVVGLVVVLAALAIPTVRMLTADLKVREAGRDLQSFVQDAQNAARSEGEAGIWIQRDPIAPNTSLLLYRVKMPVPFSGDFDHSACRIVNEATGLFADFPLTLSGPLAKHNNPSIADVFATAGPLNVFDLRFGQKGFHFFANTVGTSYSEAGVDYWRVPLNVYATAPGYPASATLPTPLLPQGASPLTEFEVRRPPIRQNLRQLTMPNGTFIDLSLSGFSAIDFDGDNSASTVGVDALGTDLAVDAGSGDGYVLILFGSDGSIDSVRTSTGIVSFPSGQSLFLLVANDRRNDGESYDAPDGLVAANFPDYGTPGFPRTIDDRSNLWLTLGRNGRVTLSDMSDVVARTSDSVGDTLIAARSLAIDQVQVQAE